VGTDKSVAPIQHARHIPISSSEVRDWKLETSEHGGDEPDNMPQAITATDTAERWAVYVPLTRGGRIMVPRPYSETATT
jgi:hypothetical protein